MCWGTCGGYGVSSPHAALLTVFPRELIKKYIYFLLNMYTVIYVWNQYLKEICGRITQGNVWNILATQEVKSVSNSQLFYLYKWEWSAFSFLEQKMISFILYYLKSYTYIYIYCQTNAFKSYLVTVNMLLSQLHMKLILLSLLIFFVQQILAIFKY